MLVARAVADIITNLEALLREFIILNDIGGLESIEGWRGGGGGGKRSQRLWNKKRQIFAY